MYLDTYRTSHIFGSMLSKLNALTLQKEFHNCLTNNVFMTKKSKNTKTKQNS